VTGLSSHQRRFLSDHGHDGRTQPTIVRIALNHYRRPELGTAALAEREINHHHIAAVDLHEPSSRYVD